MSVDTFVGIDGADVRITLSAASQRVKVFSGTPNSFIGVRIANLSTATAWIRGGDVTVTAAVTNRGVGAGVHEVQRFRIPASGELYIAAIAAATPGDIEFCPGSGI